MGKVFLFGRDVLVSAECLRSGGVSWFERGCRLSRVSLFGVGCSCLLRAKRLAVSAPREQRHQCKRRPLLAKTKLLSLRNTIGVLSSESILSTNTRWDIINRHRDKRFSVAKAQALRRARWGGSLALELLRLAVFVRANGPFTGRNVIGSVPIRPKWPFTG